MSKIDDEEDDNEIIDTESELYESEYSQDEDSDDIEETKIAVVPNPDSKHKEKGKHRLKYDSIFKGKKDEQLDEDYSTDFSSLANKSFEPESSSNYSYEKENPYEYKRLNDLRNDMHSIIVEFMNLDLTVVRRKPSRIEFNKNFKILSEKLDMYKYTYSELFIEFSVYFSDNFNSMFKLLDNKWRGIISSEVVKKGNLNGTKNLEDIDFV